jgi:hypothetical protein
MTHGTGQLKPLEERMNQHQLEQRDRKIAARRIVAAQLQGQINRVGQYAVGFAQQGLWGRLRWLLLGHHYANAKGNYLMVGLIMLFLLTFVGGYYVVTR